MNTRFTRRDALELLGTAAAIPFSSSPDTPLAADFVGTPAQAGGVPGDQNKKWRGSALDNLYPFIKQEQQRTRQRLAYLNRRPR